jgi:CRP/FNR family transcriptional regulator, dissimilatory nitrate respiration regulator
LDERKSRIKIYRKGQIIHNQYERCNTLDLILRGQILIQRIDEDGNVLTIGAFSDRNIIGANVVFASKNVYSMTVIANSKVTLLHIPKKVILRLGQDNHDFLLELLRTISDKVTVLTDKIHQISLQTIRERITKFLAFERNIQKSNVVQLIISKKDLAEKFGVQRSSLSRELNKMRAEGLLEYDAKTITIKKSMETVKK